MGHFLFSVSPSFKSFFNPIPNVFILDYSGWRKNMADFVAKIKVKVLCGSSPLRWKA
jgi:hypothetical protein